MKLIFATICCTVVKNKTYEKEKLDIKKISKMPKKKNK